MKIRQLLTIGVAMAALSAGAFAGQTVLTFVPPTVFNKLSLLKRKEVQTELKLTAKQLSGVQDLLAKIKEASQEPIDTSSITSVEQAQEALTARRQSMDKKFSPVLAKILDDGQNRRLSQIELQTGTANLFIRPEIVSALKLTTAQTAKVKEIIEAMKAKAAELMQNAGGGFQNIGTSPEMRIIQQRSRKDCLALLDKDQMAAWKNLTGDEFKLID